MRTLPMVLFLALVAVGCDDEPAPAVAPSTSYLPRSEAELNAALEAAQARAQQSGRRVLLDFGADWCPDCNEVLRLTRESPVKELLAESYETVVIDVGHFDRHQALLQRYGIDRIATLVVLDGAGQRVAQTTLEPISGAAEGLTAEALAGWLRSPANGWQPR